MDRLENERYEREGRGRTPLTLGKSSLYLGIAAMSFVFGIGMCAIVGLQHGILFGGGTILFVCGASSAFVGLIGAILGVASLITGERPRGIGVTGLIFGVMGACLFITILGNLGG